MVLVTGSTGFLGSELVKQLIADGQTVRILRRETSSLDLLGEVGEKVEHAIGDITDPDSLPAAFHGVYQAYHTAADIGFGGDTKRLFAVNVEGTANVVDAAREAGVKRLVHVSSLAAFGRTASTEGIIDEASEWVESAFNSDYARSKYLSELEVHRAIAEGLDAVIVNPALIFGPGRSGENTTQIVERARRGALLAPAGGTNVVDVADVAACMRAAMEKGHTGERYFLGSENLTFTEIMCILGSAFGKSGPRFILPPALAIAAGGVLEVIARLTGGKPILTRETARVSGRFYRYSNEKARTELGCSFRPFADTAGRIARASE